MYEGLLVWSSELGMDGWMIWALKPYVDDLVILISKSSTMGLTGGPQN
jgi:hypothetical protein